MIYRFVPVDKAFVVQREWKARALVPTLIKTELRNEIQA